MSGKLEDIRDLWERNKLVLIQTMPAKTEQAGLIVRAERIDKKHVHREKWDLVKAGEDRLSVLPVEKWKSLSEHAEFRMQTIVHDMYGLFKFVPSYNIHTCMYKRLKETVLAYVSSYKILINLGHVQQKQKPLIQV